MGIFDLAVGTCGCCEPPAPGTPVVIFNRPSLDSIEYRVGTFPTFRRAAITLVPEMGVELAGELGLATPPLHRWTSENSDDYGVAFVEMWATIADILTFYQERYANLAWLRTATDRDAVRKLAQLLGYRLKPGLAASVHLAFTLDPATSVIIPAGSRAQSVPDEGQTPQKFETAAPLAAVTEMNRVRVWGPPSSPTNQLTPNMFSATLQESAAIPAAGERMVLVNASTGSSQEVTVESTSDADGRTTVHWSQALNSTFDTAFIARRRLRQFGHNLPATHLVSTPTTTGSFLTWEDKPTNLNMSGDSTLFLDGNVEGLEAGGHVLVGSGLRRVKAVTQTTHTIAPFTGAATELRLSAPVGGKVNKVTVLELGEQLHFDTWHTPDAPITPTTDLYLSTRDVTGIEPKRTLILDDAANDPMVVQVKATQLSGPTNTEFLRVTLTKPTTRTLDQQSAQLLGNVAAATHGETVSDEILGNGDRSQSSQSFVLKKSPVTYTSDPTAPGGARSSLQLFVDNVKWAERSGLFGSGPEDRVFAASIDDDQNLKVQLGDGETGALLPTGRANVVATYREGLGQEGNKLRPGQIRTALDKPVGLKEVANPTSSAGGVDPESTNAARENAPNTVRTFDRAVSLRDFADLAREYNGVAKTLATWVWDHEERVVHVTVGGDEGAPVEDLSKVLTYLDLRRDPNRGLRVGEYRPVPFIVKVLVNVEPVRFRDDVEESVRAAIRDYFAFDNRGFGEAVHLSDLYAVVQEVPGVVSLVVDLLHYRNSVDRLSHGLLSTPSVVHAPIFAATHNATTRTILPAELAVLANPTTDIMVSLSGGIAS